MARVILDQPGGDPGIGRAARHHPAEGHLPGGDRGDGRRDRGSGRHDQERQRDDWHGRARPIGRVGRREQQQRLTWPDTSTLKDVSRRESNTGTDLRDPGQDAAHRYGQGSKKAPHRAGPPASGSRTMHFTAHHTGAAPPAQGRRGRYRRRAAGMAELCVLNAHLMAPAGVRCRNPSSLAGGGP